MGAFSCALVRDAGEQVEPFKSQQRATPKVYYRLCGPYKSLCRCSWFITDSRKSLLNTLEKASCPSYTHTRPRSKTGQNRFTASENSADSPCLSISQDRDHTLLGVTEMDFTAGDKTKWCLYQIHTINGIEIQDSNSSTSIHILVVLQYIYRIINIHMKW